VLLALRALAILQQEHDSETTVVTTVATSPRTALRARRISSVMEELLASARTEIIVLGYELSDQRVIDRLAHASAAGVQVSLLLDSVQSPDEPIVRTWARSATRPRLWRSSEDGEGRPIRLHAKALIVDGRRALIGSANMTVSGMDRNIELGILMEGAVVRRVRAYVQELIERRFVVEVLPLGP
jgi:phosphatidylserine/phosphatidylglycerophosphate/cardiolipin synthase-like enzyme